MNGDIQYDELRAALSRCGATWDPAQAHGLITSRLAVEGPAAAAGVVSGLLEQSDPANALLQECAGLIGDTCAMTHRQLMERQSAFAPLLPDDDEDSAGRAAALAAWCEGFLHGLVSAGGPADAGIRERLARDPLADIIADMLEITRAASDVATEREAEEEAYAELVEYLRIAAQLVYEELADLRPATAE